MWNMQNTIMPSSKCAYTSIDAYIYAYINLFLSLLLEIYVFHTFLLHFSFTKCDIYEWWMIAKLDLLWHGIGSEFAMYDSISSPHTMARNFQTNRAILAVVARKKNKEFPHAFHAHVWKYPVSKFEISWIFSKRITYAYEQQSQIIRWMLVVFSFFSSLGRPPEVLTLYIQRKRYCSPNLQFYLHTHKRRMTTHDKQKKKKSQNFASMNQNNTTTFLQLAFLGIEIEIEIMQWKSNAKSKVKQIIHSRKCFPHDNFLDAEKRKNSKERSQARRVCVWMLLRFKIC